MTLLYRAFGWCLALFYSWTNNYGWAVVIFSVFAQLIMLPLSLKQAKSMEVQKALQPQIQKIQAQFPADKNRQNEELMKLYEENNYNPMSGCLPILIQFPIIIGLFGVLRDPATYVFGSAEAYAQVEQSFLWIQNMTVTPMQLIKGQGLFAVETVCSLILPLACVLLTYFQSKLTTTDNSQKSMMIMMTAMIGYCSLTLSQGICIYWTLRTALGIVQQKVIAAISDIEVKVPKRTKKK